MVHSRKRKIWSTQVGSGKTRFINYYKAQLTFMEHCEFEKMLFFMSSPLPVTFRINQSCYPLKIEEMLVRCIEKINDKFSDSASESKLKLTKISWCGPGIYQLNMSREEIRRDCRYEPIKNFFVNQIRLGNLSRQELVSMIPPLLLDLKPHHKVLDMCAAPGSKTSQIVELLLQLTKDDTSANDVKNGLLIANDKDNRRCHTLWHQLKPLNYANIAVVNHDASMLPNWRFQSEESIDQPSVSYTNLLFDRILCDVPCSGDGTARKNDIFNKWHPAVAYNLHSVQYRIAKRGVELLNPNGGILVYSTCSLNPIENECVIARLLNTFPDELTIEPIDTKLHGLKTFPGLTNWLLLPQNCDQSNEMFQKFEDVPKEDKKLTNLLRSSLFPPENIKQLNMERALRILPHSQNTGGFFICVLKKAIKICDESKNAQNIKLINSERFCSIKNESQFVSIHDESHSFGMKVREEIDSMIAPVNQFPFDQLVCRKSEDDHHKKVYYINKSLRKLLLINPMDRLKLIGAGIRFMVQCNFAVHQSLSYRITSEAVPFILPYIDPKKLIIKIDSPTTMIDLLSYSMIFLNRPDLNVDDCLYSKIECFANGRVVIFEFNINDIVKTPFVIGKTGKQKLNDLEGIWVRTFISHHHRYALLSMLIQDDDQKVEDIMKRLKESEKK